MYNSACSKSSCHLQEPSLARRTAQAAAQTRTDIVSSARELFAQHGFSATTTAEVAARAGVTVGALFHHFKDKVELFSAVFDELDEEMNLHALERAGLHGGLSGFLEGFRAFLEFAQRQDYHRIVLVDGPAVLGDRLASRRDKLRGANNVHLGVEALIAAGEIPLQPVAPLAAILLGAITECGFALARRDPGVTVKSSVSAMEGLLKGRAG